MKGKCVLVGHQSEPCKEGEGMNTQKNLNVLWGLQKLVVIKVNEGMGIMSHLFLC